MNIFTIIKNVTIGFFEGFNTDWWVEIKTTYPRCTYYFGDFDNLREAKEYCSGYIEDLQSEGARGIKVSIKRCQPQAFTICEE
ncbi:MAG TPA: DUF1816 domain-containing protein [Oculatellaceae cyanobacterium]|jgi:hypothetical protein